jgi:Uroporphyrinogen decarboxylase (URO-D).
MNIVEREISIYTFGNIDRLPRRDWGIFDDTKKRWASEGWDGNYEQFLYDENPYAEELIDLVGIDLPLVPAFKEEIIDENDEYIYIRTVSGAVEQFPKGKSRLTGESMPFYVKHPVETEEDWYNKIKPRLNPDSPERWVRFNKKSDEVLEIVNRNKKLYEASSIGGYMFLRAMMGPEKTLLAFYDYPDMVHDMMKTWLHLVKTCLLRVQSKIPFFKFLMGEDISYKNGLLISPEMVEEFLFPYYNDLFNSLRKGQEQFLHLEIDTDGNLWEVLPLYMKVGFNVFRPFEVAAGNDVVEYAVKYPKLVISGGIDKRILSESKEAIRKELVRIMPFMVERGGFIPTCDHNVPSTVSYENYLFYRQLMTTLDSCNRGGNI